MLAPSPIGKVVTAYVDPQFYGGVIAICMFGICISQTWTYIHTNDDRWPLQATVGFLFLFVFGCTLLDTFVLHHYLVLEYGNIIELTRITPEISIFTLFTLIVIVTSDLCFATRVWRLRRIHWTITAAISITAVGALVPGITLVNALLKYPTIAGLDNFHRKLEVGFINILAAVSQCMSTFGLWYSFQAHINEVPSTPQSVLQRLRTIVVNRGALLTICQLLVAFLFFHHPEKLYWSPFHLFLAPLYYMTMLATLNCREPRERDRAQSLSWEISPESPTPLSVFNAQSTSERGTSLGRGFGNEIRMRMGFGNVTPFPLDSNSHSSVRVNPSITTTPTTRAFSAFTPRERPLSRKKKREKEKEITPFQTEKFVVPAGNELGSDISLVDRKDPILIPEPAPRRKLPPIPAPALL